MKVCETCEQEYDGKDGDNRCSACERSTKRRKNARRQRAAIRDVYDSLGMTRVRGALGGVYYE